MFIPGLYTARPVANDQSTTTDAIHPAPAVYVIVRNAETADMSEGYAVCVTADGVGAEKPTTAKLNCFLGTVRETISAFATPVYCYGLVQTYGYSPTTLILADDTSAAAGDSLHAVDSQWYMLSNSATNTGLNMGLAQTLEAYTNTVTAANNKCWIHAM
jgi:hypothetical protein